MSILDFNGGQNPGARWFPILLGLLSLSIVGSTCYAVLGNHHPIPYQDHWDILATYIRYLEGELGFSALWSQHNEHRILFPRLFYLLDYRWAGGTGYSLLILMLVIQGIHALILGWWAPRRLVLPGIDRALIASVAVVFSFWLIQRENLLWPVQICFLLNGMSASMAAYLFCLMDRARERKFNHAAVCASAAFSLVSTYSLANGIVIWGILLIVAWKAKLSQRLLSLWCLIGGGAIAFYLAGYYSPAYHSPLAEAFRFRTIHYLFVYLGNPLSMFFPQVGSVMGMAGLALFFWFTWKFLTCKAPEFFQRFGFSLSAFAVATGMVTAMGRQNFGVIQATSGRYQTPVLIFWFSLLLFAYTMANGREWLPRCIRASVCLFLLLVALPTQYLLSRELESHYLKCDEASLALLAGVGDTSAVHFLYPLDEPMPKLMGFLRTHRLSVYRDAWTITVGENQRAAFSVDSSFELRGEMERARPVVFPRQNGLYVKGKLILPGNTRVPEVILFSRHDTILGFANTRKRPCRECYSGYVRGSDNRFDAFALAADGGSLKKIQFSFSQ